MAPDSEIGRIVAIDTAQVSIELNRDLKGMSRNTYEGAQDVGRINSYVIIPVGARRLVAMITRVVLVEEAEMKADRTMVALPAARRLMKATLIGTIDGASFRQGVSIFPVLDNPVHLAGRSDLDSIFGPIEHGAEAVSDPDEPGYCVPIGESAVVQAGPFGSIPTRSSASTLPFWVAPARASPARSQLCCSPFASNRESSGPRASSLTLTASTARRFRNQKGDDSWKDTGPGKALYIPSDRGKADERLAIPYWFMNAEDFARLFQASKGVQRPVLLEALRLARNDTASASPLAVLREELVHEMNRIWSLSGKDEKTSKDVRDVASGLKRRIRDNDFAAAWGEAETKYTLTKDDVEPHSVRCQIRQGPTSTTALTRRFFLPMRGRQSAMPSSPSTRS